MRILKRMIVPLAAVVAIVLAVMGGLETMHEAPPAATIELRYNAIAEGVELALHDATGNRTYALRAASQTRFNNERVEWRRPSLQWFDQGNTKWQVDADQGVLAAAGASLRLQGNVALRQQATAAVSPLTLLTSVIEIDLADETLTSDAPVQMIAGQLRQDSAGMLLDLAEDSLLLSGASRGRHVRP